jgi:penicillin-binding protein 1C
MTPRFRVRSLGKSLLRSARHAAWLVVAAVALCAAAWFAFPFPDEILETFPASLTLTDRDGQPLRIRLGPGGLDCRPDYHPQQTDWIAMAIVAAEDRRFWSHLGVDVLALGRALTQNALLRRRVSGASTLSMQTIRLAQPRRRTVIAKAIEAFRSLQMEARLSKQEILAQYLNRAPFGSNIVGIEAAARRYFCKNPKELSLGEAALLAGLPQSPSRLRPDRYPARARNRQSYVLDRMLACGMITESQRLDALTQPLDIRPSPYPFRAPHFTDLAAQQSADSGLELRTTLDASLQQVAEDAIRRAALSHEPAGVRGGAAVILDVQAGAVRALVGSPDFFERHNGQYNTAAAARSAGSTLKPFAYALAFDRGLITPQTTLFDVPQLFRDYEPRNFDETCRGLVSARDALILSLNMPAIDVERRVGQPLLYATLRRLGLDTMNRPSSDYGLGLVLGNGEVRLLDLANAYACLARGGGYLPYRLLEDRPAGRSVRAFSEEACWLISETLGGDERAMDATGHAADVRLPPLAWKTGTSAGYHDAWTVAYNREVVVAIWFGNPDSAPSDRLVGCRAAAPVVWEIMRSLYPDNNGPAFDRPPGVERRKVCAISGCVPGPNCPKRAEAWYIPGVSLSRSCSVHVRPADAEGKVTETWPAEVASFLSRNAQSPATIDARPVRITSPASGSVFRMIPNGDCENQRLTLSAAAGAATALHWFINDHYIGCSRPGQPLLWPLDRGHFGIVCSDNAGHSDLVTIAVD